jgi:TolA-binding protein
MSKPRLVSICLLLAIGAAAMAVALLTLSRRAIRIAEKEAEVTRLQKENLELRARSDRLAGEIEALRGQLVEVPPEGQTPVSSRAMAELPPGTLEALRNLGQLREELASAKTTVEQLRGRVWDLENQLGKVKEDNRLAPLQMSNKALREENREAREKLARVAAWTTQLEDINRRRESYISNILRRYRDVTEQYRALTARLGSPSENEAPAGAEASRIENAVSMAEEDLRQLSNLNAQAERLQKRIMRE